MTRPIPTLAFVAVLATLNAQPSAAATHNVSLDATLAALLASTGTPGASATITRRGQVLWSGAAGMADPAAGTPFTRDTLSSVASVTKLFTSAIVTRMAEEGLIDLDAAIAPYVTSGLPGSAIVTLRQLRDHTAGYADLYANPEISAALADPNHVWTREALLAPIAAPQFEPGSAYDYSNTNYLLLGQVIDAVYPGGTDAAFQTYIAGPAGLGDDVVWTRDAAVAPRVAHGFSTAGGVTTDVSADALDLGVSTSVWGTLWTDGGIVATSEGLALFSDALYGGSILNSANTAEAITCVYELSNRCWTGFVGAFNGYASYILHDAEREISITVVVNALNQDTTAQFDFIPGLVEAFEGSELAPSPVPLPGSLPILLSGLGALAFVGRKRQQRARQALVRHPKV